MKYTEIAIDTMYKENLDQAHVSLSNLPVANGRLPSFTGLNGWVYEQTIRFCLEQELKLLGADFLISEQFKLRGRARADLLVGRVAIEIKAGGLFGDESEKYSKYKYIATEKHLVYIYITRQETYKPYNIAARSVFGKDKSFFLTEKGSWQAFVKIVAEENGVEYLVSGCHA